MSVNIKNSVGTTDIGTIVFVFVLFEFQKSEFQKIEVCVRIPKIWLVPKCSNFEINVRKHGRICDLKLKGFRSSEHYPFSTRYSPLSFNSTSN